MCLFLRDLFLKLSLDSVLRGCRADLSWGLRWSCLSLHPMLEWSALEPQTGRENKTAFKYDRLVCQSRVEPSVAG